MHLPNTKPHQLAALTASIVLFACGGGSDTPAETVPDPVVTSTPTPSPTPSPTPTPTACTAAPIGSTGYSLVFKGCSATNVAEYYDKTDCVRDNASGLIWQGQTAAGTGLRANDAYKTNFDRTTGNQNLNNGTPIPATPAQIAAETNATGFKYAVQASNLCGNNSLWRLPTKDELLGIVNLNETPKINNIWFPNTASKYYWTSSPPSVAFDDLASVVDFQTGLSDNRDRDGSTISDSVLVRLVRQ